MSATPLIRDSFIEGSSASIEFESSGDTKIIDSVIIGGFLNNPIDANCINTYDLDLMPAPC